MILQDQTQTTTQTAPAPDMDALLAQIAKLQADNAKLKASRNSKLTLKVSAKGAISVYGMGKWPITLYSQQWERLLDNAEDIRAFIAANADLLSVKE